LPQRVEPGCVADEIEKGALYFTGPLDNPGLEIRAMRLHQQVEAGVDMHQPQKAFDEDACARDQYQSDRDLGNHQQIAAADESYVVGDRCRRRPQRNPKVRKPFFNYPRHLGLHLSC
jgi:hypothetical protein